jgi:hypothetical protein
LGQPVLPLDMPSPLRSAPARRRAALPVHELRSTMISRTQAATESMIVDLRLAAQARAKVPAGQNAVFILVAQLAKSAIREPHAPPHPAGRPGCAAGLELKIARSDRNTWPDLPQGVLEPRDPKFRRQQDSFIDKMSSAQLASYLDIRWKPEEEWTRHEHRFVDEMHALDSMPESKKKKRTADDPNDGTR